MALNFPKDPEINEPYTYAGTTWVWDGGKWTSKGLASGLPLYPDQDGNVVITGTLTVEGTTITGNAIAATSANLSGDLTAVNGDLSGNLNVAGDIDND